MKYSEEQKDLFTVPSDYMLCHCISSDFALGAGIAAQFTKRGVRMELTSRYKKNEWANIGYCLTTNATGWVREYNLVTKEKCYNKPTYETLEEALRSMRDAVMLSGIEEPKIAMPKIGCGLDQLEWSKVSELIKKVFDALDVEILVCYQ